MKFEPGASSFFFLSVLCISAKPQGVHQNFFSALLFKCHCIRTLVECEGKKRGGSFAVKILREGTKQSSNLFLYFPGLFFRECMILAAPI